MSLTSPAGKGLERFGGWREAGTGEGVGLDREWVGVHARRRGSGGGGGIFVAGIFLL